MQPLKGKVAVVAGATRGAGRGIACMLGEAGATVYCTGRSIRGRPNRTGYFAGRLGAPLDWAPVSPAAEPPALRFTFAIAAGVRKTDAALRDRVQTALDRHADEVAAILDAYAVPRVATP